MDIKKLKELIEFMKENDIGELEVEEEGKKVKLSRATAQKILTTTPHTVTSAAQESPAQPPPHAPKENLLEIKSPMVGTFYSAPAPSAEPFTEIGSMISPGNVVCIIEAMKLMNEIKSEIKGEIKEILAENGDPVEYGQTLFLVKPGQ